MATATQSLALHASILSASDDSLSTSLAFLNELSFWNVLYSKSADVAERVWPKADPSSSHESVDHFQERVMSAAKGLECVSRAEKLLRLIGELQAATKVAPRDLRTRFDLEEVLEDLCAAAVRIVIAQERGKKNSAFRQHDLQGMLSFHISKMFGGVEISFEELSADQQATLLCRVREFIAKLPPDQQRFVMDKIGAQDLTDAAIRQAVVTGSIWGAFAAAVEVFGFGFYTAAAHLLSIASLHMLPFGAYAFMSSFVSLVTGPLMILLGGIGAWWLYGHTNRKIREEMTPLLVTCVCLAGMEARSQNPELNEQTADEALYLWTLAREARDRYRASTSKAQRREKQVSSELAETSEELRTARSSRSELVRRRHQHDAALRTLVTASVADIAAAHWAAELTAAAMAVQKVDQRRRESIERYHRCKGLLQNLAGTLRYTKELLELNAEGTSRLSELVAATKQCWQTDRDSFPGIPSSLLDQIDKTASALLDAEARVNALEAKIRLREQVLQSARKELASALEAQHESEQRYFGLEIL